nr:vigilin-like isoform X2 [Cherax quadricarinatus]
MNQITRLKSLSSVSSTNTSLAKGGANIRKIREETSTRIELPSEGQKSNEITITGKKEDCEKACEIIKKIQDDLIVEVNIYIPVKLHKSLIGPRGKLLRHVSEECGGVDITFPPPDITSDKVTIRGPKEEVHRAEVMLEDLSNEKQLAIYTAEEEKAKLRLQFEGAAPILDPEIIVDTLTIDPGYHQHFLSWRGEVLPQIRDECIGVTISFPRLGLHDDKVTFRGLRKYVERAKDYIQEMVNNLHGLTLEVIIPQIYHDFLQGVRGSKVQALATKFKVYIRFPEKDRGYFARGKQNHGQLNCKVSEEAGVKPQDIVRITGQEDRCKVARDALLNLVPVTVEENIAFRHHRFIIGQNFKNILNVMTEFDVNIQMPKPEDQSNIIKIVGSPANIQHAREALREKVCYLENKESIQKARIFQSWIEKDSEYNKVIRKKRCLICKIRGNCKCRYQFPPRTDAEEHITIEKLNKMINSADIDANIQFRHFSKISCKDAIEEAKRQLKAIFEEIKFIVEDTVTVAVKHHRHFISRRCEVLRQISDQYGGVIISFPWSGVQRDKVTIKGAREYVEGAKARIMEIVNDLEVNLEVIIPQKHHHFLLGVQGSKVHALSTKFKVQIRFPKKGSISLANGKQSQGQINGKVNEKAGVRPQDIVHITGQKDRCEAARDALLNLVPVTVEENITYGFLLFITGKKGKNAFRIMTKYNVVIFVPQYGSNIIKITGSPANTECARQAIREKMHQLKEEESDQKAGSFRLQVEVDPEYHPRIIGKIENKHNVTIQFPPFSDVKKNIITITGFKKNVHDANAAILALTREWHKMVTHTIQIDSRLYYLVRGRTVKKVMEKFKVTIKGAREYVQGAKARIMEIVNDLEVNLEFNYPTKTSSFFAGCPGQ